MKQLHESILEVLDQVKNLITSCDKQVYSNPSQHSLSSIGQHIRHIIDHFVIFETGLKDGVINYNLRSRGNISEKDPSVALQQILELIDWFKNINLDNDPVDVISEVSIAKTQIMTIQSNIARELVYLINHTIHHVAYASLVAKQLDQEVDQNLGIAPSTVTYLKNQIK